MTAPVDPEKRFFESGKDQRTEGQRDRDRILYTLALRRLAGVTQVVSPAEGHIFHNRLTHTLEVAQIARRLAEKFIDAGKRSEGPVPVGLDPDVVEAAALAHDLGHPPFGHKGEETLRELAEEDEVDEGFEGNAQSFRIVTRLAAHNTQYGGLNLTRATLNAILKYPWLQSDCGRPETKEDKYGAYLSDQVMFDFAREGCTSVSRSLGAEIMNLADDIAYSVHDLDDFYRAGLVPIELLASRQAELEAFLDRWADDPKAKITSEDIRANRELIEDTLAFFEISEAYDGTFMQRAELRSRNSALLGDFVQAVSLVESPGQGLRIHLDADRKFSIRFLQRLVWDFVIENPRLATLQLGHRDIVRRLYTTYRDAVRAGDARLVPPAFLSELEAIKTNTSLPAEYQQIRLAVDIVASMTEDQARLLHNRITGVSAGSVVDLLHR
jgi:dGTPase